MRGRLLRQIDDREYDEGDIDPAMVDRIPARVLRELSGWHVEATQPRRTVVTLRKAYCPDCAAETAHKCRTDGVKFCVKCWRKNTEE